MEPQLNTTNPHAIEYKTAEHLYTILGGIRLEGLDRLRVTLKIEVHNRKFQHYLNNPDLADLALRHNLDLYNDTQVEKLIRKICERLETGNTTIAKNIHELTSLLEKYRLEQITLSQKDNKREIKKLTEQETEEAKEFLKSKSLLQATNEMIGKAGLVGEEQNRLLMYLIFTTRKREQPLHVISFGSSGTGKTHLQEKVAELIPEEDKIEITTLSDNAFYYFEKNELSHKLILIEDFDGAMGVLYPLRELQSKKRITKTVTFKDSRGQTKSVHLTVEGPVCVAGCTTKDNMYEDNANRSFLIYLDESTEQDEKIMNYQRALSAGNIDTTAQNKIKTLLQNSQRILSPVTIINPYAQYLQLPKEVFKPRRTNAHYLHFIEAITFYKQYQREQKVNEETAEVYIETTIEDIKDANAMMKEILLRKSDELSGACRNYFENLKSHLENSKETTFTNRSIGQALRIAHSTVKRYNNELLQVGLIKLNKENKMKSFFYEVLSKEEYQQLKDKINIVLDEMVLNIENKNGGVPHTKKQLTGSNRLSSESEPIKKKKTNKLSQRLSEK